MLSLGANAQGFFNFANGAAGINGGPSVNAPDYETDGTTKLSGSAYKADYYWGPAGVSDASQLVSGGQAVSYSGNGIFLGGTQTIANQTGTVTLQVRAWRASDGATYAAAAATPGAHIGAGNLIQLALSNGANAPQPMVGLQSFNLSTVNTPEPATIALGLMGAGALFIRRRKA